MAARAKVQRHYTRSDRRKFSQNAKKGTRIWHKTSPERRRLERDLGHQCGYLFYSPPDAIIDKCPNCGHIKHDVIVDNVFCDGL